jgi:hypothetical protein
MQTMTIARLFPLQLQAAAKALAAPAIIVLPFVLGFPGAGLVGAIVVGALTMGSALGVLGRAPRVTAHMGLDLLIGTISAGFAAGLALIGEFSAAAFFAGAAFVLALLTLTTSYSAETH